MDLHRNGCCSRTVFLCIAIIASLYANESLVVCEAVPNVKQEKSIQFCEEWTPQREKLYEQSLDTMVECLKDNKDKIGQLLMTVIKVKPLLNKLCKYNSDHLRLDYFIQPEILEIIEKAAEEFEQQEKNTSGNEIDTNQLLYELISDRNNGINCSNKKNSTIEKVKESKDDLIMQDSETIPVFLKNIKKYSTSLETTPNINDLQDNTSDGPCDNLYKDCKTSSVSNLINLLSKPAIKKTENKEHQERRSVVVTTKDNSEETSPKEESCNQNGDVDNSCDKSVECTDSNQETKCQNSKQNKQSDESSDQDTSKSDNGTKLDLPDKSTDQIGLIEQVDTSSRPILPTGHRINITNDDLYKILGCTPITINKNHQPIATYRNPCNCFPHYKPCSLNLIPNCNTDCRQYLPETDPILTFNENFNPGIPLPCPANHQENFLDLIDPKLCNWLKPSYQKCSYYSDQNAYESPTSFQSNCYIRKCDVEEGYM